MPRKSTQRMNATGFTGRLPTFGAGAALGPPSRAYRSPMGISTIGLSDGVVPSYMDEAHGYAQGAYDDPDAEGTDIVASADDEISGDTGEAATDEESASENDSDEGDES